tara:strand:+ start:252 stop:563 length:312 start_codon:yes stop_codon:yes gene_type:complete
MVVLRSGRCYFDLKGWNLRREQFCTMNPCDYYIWSIDVTRMVHPPEYVEIENLFDNSGWNDPSWPKLKGFKSQCEYTPIRCLELIELKIAEFIIKNKNKHKEM